MALHNTADTQADYERFVKRVRESKVVWGLKSIDGWATSPSNSSDSDLMLFWSDEAYARRHAIDEWAGYKPIKIDLDSFIDNWLRGMHEDGFLVGVNFNADLAGLEIEPLELAKTLTADP